MNWTSENIPSQIDKVFVVTGANSGVGFATADVLAQKGATVIMACRSMDKAQSAAGDIRSRMPQARLVVEPLDLASLGSIRDFAERLSAKYHHIDVLINNAGVLVPPARTADGFEINMGTNFLGHFALTGLLLPLLNASPKARIVTLSSFVHWFFSINFDNFNGEKGVDKTVAYCRSKFATLVFAHELQRRLLRSGTSTVAIGTHPGIAASGISKQSKLVGWGMKVICQSAHDGALPSLRAAIDTSVKGGDFVGPGNFLHLTGLPTIQPCSKRTLDLESGRQLWERAQEMTGIHYL